MASIKIDDWYVVDPPSLRHFGFLIDHRLALGVDDLALSPDTQIATLACLPRKLHELLGVLRSVEHLA